MEFCLVMIFLVLDVFDLFYYNMLVFLYYFIEWRLNFYWMMEIVRILVMVFFFGVWIWVIGVIIMVIEGMF